MLNISVEVAILTILIIVLRFLFYEKLKKKILYSFWLLMVIRLLLPIHIFSVITNPVDLIFSRNEDKKQQYDYKTDNKIENIYEDGTNHDYMSDNYANTDYSDGKSELDLHTEQSNIISEGEKESKLNLKINKLIIADLARIIWLIGAVIIGGVFFVSNILLKKQLKSNREIYEDYESAIKIYSVPDIVVPFVYGVFDVAIYIPKDLIIQKNWKKIDMLIKHEQVHIKHGDNYWALIRMILLTIYWFNPFIWLGAWVSKLDAELACDEGVLTYLTKEDRFIYGNTIIEFAGKTTSKNTFFETVSFVENKRNIKNRVKAIANDTGNKTLSGVMLFCLMFFTIMLFGSNVSGKNNIISKISINERDYKANKAEIAKYLVDLNNDGNDDRVYVYMKNNSLDTISVVVFEGGTGEKCLYNFEMGHSSELSNLIMMVRNNDKCYLMTGIPRIKNGVCSVEYEVFDFKGDEKNVVDSFYFEYASSYENYELNKKKGLELKQASEILPTYKERVSKWIEDSVIIIGCDVLSDPGIFISTEDNVLHGSDYNNELWKKNKLMSDNSFEIKIYGFGHSLKVISDYERNGTRYFEKERLFIGDETVIEYKGSILLDFNELMKKVKELDLEKGINATVVVDGNDERKVKWLIVE